MQDLRKIFRYARPYRRDLFAAVGLIFIECIFEMVILGPDVHPRG